MHKWGIPSSLFHFGVKRLEGALITPDCYHKDEFLDIWCGMKWILLTDDGKEAKCISVKPEFKKGIDDQYGDSSVCVKVPESGYLISGVKLKLGPATRAFIGRSPYFPQRDSVVVSLLEQKKYCFLSKTLHSNEFIYLLYNGNSRFMLFAFRDRDALYGIRWIGDMDGDGRLDVVLDASDHYNVSILRLFLSSEATSGELLRFEAQLRSAGE